MKMLRWLFALCLISVACSKSPPAAPVVKDQPDGRVSEIVVPFRWFANKLIVEVKIDGRGPYEFFFDTGAQGTVLVLDLSEELNLSIVGEGRVASPGGKGLPAKQVRMKLGVGDLHLEEVKAMAFDRSQLYKGPQAPRGVLSARAFPGYLVTIDYSRNQLVFRKGELPSPDGSTIFAYDSNLPLPAIPIKLGEEAFDLFLDSGASGEVSLPLSVADRLSLVAKPVEVGRGRRVDQEIIIYGAKLKGQLKLGRYIVENPDLRFDEIMPRGLIGNAVLKRFFLTFDFKNYRIQFEEEKRG
jgi:hypothetical protein